ncbi:MAG: Gx transporter family protein [Candidatus Zophobacter franzmannii]|jgi:heptaprenyl diphosphate synthase|nr:Gx transporter family protein [Candidatus Zophobacter franzmannii]
MSKEYKIDKTNRILYLSFFTAFAVTVYIFEALIPKPLPFVRLGLANITILFLLADGFPLLAFMVTILKVLVGGFFIGTLISPVSLISLGGSIVSVIVMWLLLKSKLGLSLVGISVGGAIVHNLMQLVVLRLVLIQSDTVFKFIPLLLIIGLVSGIVTGIITLKIRERISFGANDGRVS